MGLILSSTVDLNNLQGKSVTHRYRVNQTDAEKVSNAKAAVANLFARSFAPAYV